MESPWKLLKNLVQKPATVPPTSIQDPRHFSPEDLSLLKRIGVDTNVLKQSMMFSTQINFERTNIYREVDRAILHWMVGCLRGDTEIRLCGGENVRIDRMAETPRNYIGRYTWSVNPETLNLEPDRIVAIQKTRRGAEMVRVHLDNEFHVDCTPDHKFMLRDGTYREAKDLRPQDSLMPFYSKSAFKPPLKDYELVYNPRTERWHFAHRLAIDGIWGRLKRRGKVVHHEDFNHRNNDPNNLIIMTKIYHSWYHGVIAQKAHKDDCKCCYCMNKRGEFLYGWKKRNIPWNAGLTKENDERVARCAKAQEGKVVSKETRAKIKVARANQVITEESNEKRSATLMNHSVSEETRGKIRKSLTGKPFTEERKRNIEEGKRRYRERVKLNHKVIRVEVLDEREDVYDLSTEKNHNFSLSTGIIVHNSATELYADYATNYNSIQDASVWITSDSHKYTNNLMTFLESIGVEEKIFDWGWTTAAYGDLFIGVDGAPGLGIVNIDDSLHPSNLSRVDYKGALVGFYRTPFEAGALEISAADAQLIAPWEWVHFRVLGAKKKRPVYADPSYSEYRTVHLMGPENRQVTSKYGTSLLINSLPIYKRLRLAEDSILLARLTRGILKYVYKIKVDGMNVEAASAIIDEYMQILKRARALNTDPNDPNYDSKSNPMSAVEDLFIPVWGDVNDITIEEIGGKTDIRWIVDIDELRNQLASALRCPLSLLGGFVQEASGSLGAEAISQLDIRFARSSRRLQRALIQGITRLCQIHLAYQGMDPDPRLFEVHMSETSTEEENQLRNSLDTSVDVITKFVEMLDSVTEGTDQKFDKIAIVDYFNRKLLKLGDLDLKSFLKDVEFPAAEEGGEATPGRGPGAAAPAYVPPAGEEEIVGEPGEEEMTIPPMESRAAVLHEAVKYIKREQDKAVKGKGKITSNLDYIAALPLAKKTQIFEAGSEWTTLYKDVKITTKVSKDETAEDKSGKKTTNSETSEKSEAS